MKQPQNVTYGDKVRIIPLFGYFYHVSEPFLWPNIAFIEKYMQNKAFGEHVMLKHPRYGKTIVILTKSRWPYDKAPVSTAGRCPRLTFI